VQASGFFVSGPWRGGRPPAFTRQAGDDGIEVRVADETVWLTQPLIAELFQTSVPNISMHLRGIYEAGELRAESTLKEFLTVRTEGTRQVKRSLEYYNLDAIIAVGFRVNSARAVQSESEFEKYRIVQDRLFESDFDRHIKKALDGGEETP
jgi:hypothetical protein